MAKSKSFKEYTELGNISAELVFKNLPFVLFLSFMAMIYIANAHYSEKKVREIQKLQSELKQKRWQYMSLKSELMFQSKRSEVMNSVAPLGLKTINRQSYKIVVDK
jgi:cell shape-determining protein MreC